MTSSDHAQKEKLQKAKEIQQQIIEQI